MTSGVWGADADELDRLGALLRDKAGELRTLGGRVEQRVQGVQWTGRDAERFKHDWWPPKKQFLETLCSDLEGLGQSVLNNASEQRRVSGSSHGVGGPVLPPGGVSQTHPPGFFSSGFFSSDRPEGAGEWTEAYARRITDVQLGRSIIDMVRGIDTLPSPLDLVTVPFDGWHMVDGILDDDPMRSASGALGAAGTGVAIICPPAGVAIGVGTVGINFVMDDEAVVDGYASRTYGPELDSREAAELVERYTGWRAPFRAIGDGASTRGQQITDALTFWN